ncbi:TolC family protein [Prevotella sp. AGR2160]|uniref:TolC family protein n=1 Tax=Prevotella sp. AGR2160 TaxID=1280674 RepID=UPI0004087D11|nr:TolC family protein [Prevotella sp. AGR2160]
MKRLLLLLFLGYVLGANAQRSLDDFLHQAVLTSPMIKTSKQSKLLNEQEQLRLKALYTHARWELTGDLLFVPILSTDNGKTRFKADAQSAGDYYGYDLGQSSSHLNAGIQVIQPLTGQYAYRNSQKILSIQDALSDDNIQLTTHELQRQVTEQYLLCLLDQQNVALCHTIDSLLLRQESTVRALSRQGLVSPTDVHLLEIERKNNADQRLTALQDYENHYADLNVLCGTHDTLPLAPVTLTLTAPTNQPSAFLHQYQLKKQEAEAQYQSCLDAYRPQLSFYADAGSQTGTYLDFYKRWGVSAGLHLSWTLQDGQQLKRRRREMEISRETLDYQQHFVDQQRQTRLRQLLQLMKTQDKRIRQTDEQIRSYRVLLSDYEKEMMVGRRSVIDQLKVFRDFHQACTQRNLLNINKQIQINTYHYWNW